MKNTMMLILTTFTAAFTVASAMAATQGTQIIYGEDNRLDISEVRNAQVRTVAKSVAARVQNGMFMVDDNKFSFDVAPKLSDPWGAMVCEDEKFASQPTISDCSGFLVGEDLMVTAGHCVVDYPGEFRNEVSAGCADYSWMFDYKSENGEVQTSDLDVENLYSCKEVIYGVMNDSQDFALIKLDRKVTDRQPLKMRARGKVSANQEIFVVGYPSGLPIKYAGGARVFDNNEADYFSTNLDSFGGNSGSPVFNADTYEVEGILVRGKTDYVIGEKDGQACRRVNHCAKGQGDCLIEDEDIDGEHVNRVNKILSYL